MPTYNQRAVSVVDSLVTNGPATTEQRARIAAAFSTGLPVDATQAQISERFIRELRSYVLDRVQIYETQDGISALRISKATSVPNEFPEAP
jgi:uncharacterized protein RhaS with RHS repeats